MVPQKSRKPCNHVDFARFSFSLVLLPSDLNGTEFKLFEGGYRNYYR